MKKVTKYQINYLIKLAVIASLVAGVIIIAKNLHLQGFLVNTLMFVENLGPTGPIAFILIYNLATLLLIPGALLTIGGGVLFGLVWGTIYVLIAAFVGATLAFLIGRYLSQDWVRKQLHTHLLFQAIDDQIIHGGWKLVLLTRLCPIFPFNLLNYAFGVMQVSLKDYIIGSIGIIPGTIMYVYWGAIIGDLANINQTNHVISLEMQLLQWGMRICGLIATVGVSFYLAKIGKKALDQTLITHKNEENLADEISI